MTKTNLPNRDDVKNAIDSMRTVIWEWLKEAAVFFAFLFSGFAVIGTLIYGLVEYTIPTFVALAVGGVLLWFAAEVDSARANRVRNSE
jgi:uncharacterized membrane protein YraQ (UPF0718 family)